MMKFVCDRCGKRYATSDDPAPGKVYKLRCRACGHLVVVEGQLGTMTAIPAITAAEIAAATTVSEPDQAPAADPPELVADEAIEPMPGQPEAALAPLPPEVAQAADAAPGLLAPPPPLELEPRLTPPPALLDPDLTPPPPEKDELADFAAATAEVMTAPVAAGEADRPTIPGYRDIFGESGMHKLPEDSFTAAARASLPDSWAGLPATTAPPTPRPAPPPGPPQGGRSGMPIAIIGVGMMALIAIAAWALFGRGGAPSPPPVAVAAEPRPAPPVVEERPPAPTAAPAPVVEAPPEPAPATKGAESRPEPRPEPKGRAAEKRVERRAEARVAEPKVAERRPEPARPPPAQEPGVVPHEEAVADSAAVITPEVLSRVLGANRKAFTTCIGTAGRGGLALDGRRVALRFTINANGTVTYPTLDDQSLNATELGQCLKSAARLMIFPRFKGDPFHYEVPLVLGDG
jgi:DNA-directed RNA polymerase subunit RPC12/RpoP